MQFIFRIPSRFMTVFFGFDPCVTIYYEILFRKSELIKHRALSFLIKLLLLYCQHQNHDLDLEFEAYLVSSKEIGYEDSQ